MSILRFDENGRMKPQVVKYKVILKGVDKEIRIEMGDNSDYGKERKEN